MVREIVGQMVRSGLQAAMSTFAMRFHRVLCRMLLGLTLVSGACHPMRSNDARATGKLPAKPSRQSLVEAPGPRDEIPAVGRIPAPSYPISAAEVTHSQWQGIRATGVSFDSRQYRLAVVDQPGGPGSRFEDAESAARAAGGVAAINGGFFTPEGAPLGSVIAAGVRAGSWNASSSLGSGVWLRNRNGHQAILPRSVSPRPDPTFQMELLQAGPMLISAGKPSAGLNSVNSAGRTLVVWDGRQRWWIGQTSSCTLDQLARWLHTSPPVPWQIHHALNLDGGTSCDLWISGQIPAGPVVQRSWLAKPVRNFLVLLPG